MPFLSALLLVLLVAATTWSLFTYGGRAVEPLLRWRMRRQASLALRTRPAVALLAELDTEIAALDLNRNALDIARAANPARYAAQLRQDARRLQDLRDFIAGLPAPPSHRPQS